MTYLKAFATKAGPLFSGLWAFARKVAAEHKSAVALALILGLTLALAGSRFVGLERALILATAVAAMTFDARYEP